MNDKKTVIQTHPVIGWDISTVDSYDAMMLRPDESPNDFGKNH